MTAATYARQGAPVRRHSRLAGQCEGTFWQPFSRHDTGRFMLAAERYERATRVKGQRYGALGSVALEVLRELLRVVDFKSGRLEPTIAYLQSRARRSRPAIVRALKALRTAGFLDWIRRYVPTGLSAGPQVQQTSNAYRLALPLAAQRLLGAWSTPRPVPDDQDAHAAANRRTRAEGAFIDTPLGSTFARLEKAVRDREFIERSESAIMIFKDGEG